MFHAKRARMTSPKDPLWRFAIPLTPTLKCYRPTHRAATEQGAIAWDTSYMSTIQLRGTTVAMQSLLTALGQEHVANQIMQPNHRLRWIKGSRSWQGWLFASDKDIMTALAPVTVLWQPELSKAVETIANDKDHKDTSTRTVFIRVHPSAFHRLWDEVIRLAAKQSPAVTADDVRFEIGSIEVAGAAATEALQSALWPYQVAQSTDTDLHAATWQTLSAVQNPAILPSSVTLSFDIVDPRLRFPPRPLDMSSTPNSVESLNTALVKWPLDDQPASAGIFVVKRRRVVARAMPSQRTINRRKSAAEPGRYPSPTANDPPIPCLLYTDTARSPSKRASWTVLLPWSCVQAVWYSLTYYPLSTGGQVRFGGIDEQRQLCFEAGVPWFPGDFPGTEAGDEWEVKESARRLDAWDRRPRGKRVHFDGLKVATGSIGEVGRGTACDWAVLAYDGRGQQQQRQQQDQAKEVRGQGQEQGSKQETTSFVHLPLKSAIACLSKAKRSISASTTNHASVKSTHLIPTSIAGVDLAKSLVTVRITLLSRGVPAPCARIYRLPIGGNNDNYGGDSDLRARWLALVPGDIGSSKEARVSNPLRRTKTALFGKGSREPLFVQGATIDQTQKRIAKELIASSSTASEPAIDDYPPVPGHEHLIGFVTTGEFCLSDGKGIAIGSLSLGKAMRDDERARYRSRLAEADLLSAAAGDETGLGTNSEGYIDTEMLDRGPTPLDTIDTTMSDVTDPVNAGPDLAVVSEAGPDHAEVMKDTLDTVHDKAKEAAYRTHKSARNKQGSRPSRGPSKGDGQHECLCIVRNAGETMGRLARWELI